jgi:hypothetical protein
MRMPARNAKHHSRAPTSANPNCEPQPDPERSYTTLATNRF